MHTNVFLATDVNWWQGTTRGNNTGHRERMFSNWFPSCHLTHQELFNNIMHTKHFLRDRCQSVMGNNHSCNIYSCNSIQWSIAEFFSLRYWFIDCSLVYTKPMKVNLIKSQGIGRKCFRVEIKGEGERRAYGTTNYSEAQNKYYYKCQSD